MIGIVAKLTIKDGSQQAFEDLMSGLMKEVRANEPGNIMYQLMLKSGSTTEYYVIEQYKDAEAVAAHGRSAHFRAASPKMGAMLDGRPEIIRMEPRG
jgi:quinol monooxygenase YgiN